MGVTFERGSLIAGYRPAVFKNALRGLARTQNPGAMIDLKSVFSLRRDGAIVYEECLDRGLIDPATNKPTEKGEIIARAKVVSRTPLDRAKDVLDDFLDRVDLLNRDAKALSHVDEVWLFGSVMREEATVGDIDLAICKSRRAGPGNPNAEVAQAEKLIAQFHDAPDRWARPWDAVNWLFRRTVFGPRRHPLLAGAQENTDDLASMGVPCQLIYDRKRGGRVSDPIVDRHPASNGRENTVPPIAELPNLAASALRPMDARWISGFDSVGSVSPFALFRGWSDDCCQLFPHYPRNLRVTTGGGEIPCFPWTPPALKRNALDGRSAIAFVDATEAWGTSVILNRDISVSGGDWRLSARFSDLALHRSRKHINSDTLPDMAAAASIILAVDAERILRRSAEMGMETSLAIDIGGEDLPAMIQTHFVTRICDMLDRRAIRVEPAVMDRVVTVRKA